MIHAPDVFAEDWLGDDARNVAERLGSRAVVAAPLLRESNALGAVIVSRAKPAPFNEKEIALLRTFADQAVIAIENVRLFNELKARNRELTEALEQQTATAEILEVISSSPTDVQPVLDAVASTAARLCDASDALIFRLDGDRLRQTARHDTGLIPGLRADDELPADRGSVTGRSVVDRKTVHVHDLAAADEIEYPVGRAYQRRWGHRTALSTPLLREGQAIGVIAIRRMEVRPFSDKQIKLLETFASQAVIAIENVRLFNETKEALDHQRASAEVLQVISSSVADTTPVFDKILSSCERLFEGSNVGINLVGDDGAVHLAAYHGGRTDLARHFPVPLTEESGSGAAILQRRVMHYPDVEAPGVPDFARRGGRAGGNRSALYAPMLWEGRGIGVIWVGRGTVGEFSEKEIALLKTFADQAVIAIQNARLFNETKEALERQTATAEILRTISSSPTDIQPVLDAVASTAARLCDASDALIRRLDGNVLRLVASHGSIPAPAIGEQLPIDRGSFSGRAFVDRQTIHVPDVAAAAEAEFPVGRAYATRFGFRSIVATPLLREGQPIGTIAIRRTEARPFSEKQIRLLETFASQAVIAMENVRLFNELEVRNRELTESLEQQTATAEILRVISSSPTDIQPVLDAVASGAARLCDARDAQIFRIDGHNLRLAASHGPFSISPDGEILPVSRASISGRSVTDRQAIHVIDAAALDEAEFPVTLALRARFGFRTALVTPLLRQGEAIGTILVRRWEVRPFSDKQIELVKTFADQAVIAIENVRLFNETKEALDQLKASAEVLQVISSSVADTKPVFEKILESCERLFEGRFAGVGLVGQDGAVHLGAYHGPGREALEKHFPVPLSEESGSGVAILQRRVIHYPDVEGGADVPEYMRRGARISGYKSVLLAPMLWEGRGIGVIFVGRDVVGEFSEKEIALLKTFADQAVIAIQNARLFNETKEALERQTATAEILKVISASPTDVQPVFDAIVAMQRLAGGCSVNVSRVVGDQRTSRRSA